MIVLVVGTAQGTVVLRSVLSNFLAIYLPSYSANVLPIL